MLNLSAIDFLKSSSTRLANPYGQLISIYEFKFMSSANQMIPFVFADFDTKTSLRFNMDYKTKEITDLVFNDFNNQNISLFFKSMAVEDTELMCKVFSVYMSRLEKLVDDSIESLSEFLNCAPIDLKPKFECTPGYEYCQYFLNLCTFIENNHEMDIFNYTVETLDQTDATPFNPERTLVFA